MTEAWEKARKVLAAGGVVALPTDTVWGLVARIERPEAIQRLIALKGRVGDKPFQLLVADLATARRLVAPAYRPALEKLATRFWPGPLTVVVPAAKDLGPALTPAGKVGLRLPASAPLRELIKKSGSALIGTSANKSGAPPVESEAEARALGADLVIPGHASGQASTVFDLKDRRLLRPGPIPLEELLSALSG